jgi:hypothetical protein
MRAVETTHGTKITLTTRKSIASRGVFFCEKESMVVYGQGEKKNTHEQRRQARPTNGTHASLLGLVRIILLHTSMMLRAAMIDAGKFRVWFAIFTLETDASFVFQIST